jgi:O-antigen biosynthesis protein
LKELVGYLSVSDKIGAVGGKVLDTRLRVRAGGLLLLDSPMTICEGELDESDELWSRGRVASNVEAVSVRLLATRKRVYHEAGGLPIIEYGDLAGLAYCLELRRTGYRVVYNPWSKIGDDGSEYFVDEAKKLLANRFGNEAKTDRYYHSFFSEHELYVLK